AFSSDQRLMQFKLLMGSNYIFMLANPLLQYWESSISWEVCLFKLPKRLILDVSTFGVLDSGIFKCILYLVLIVNLIFFINHIILVCALCDNGSEIIFEPCIMDKWCL
ncbi:hypothetical protein ACJX0J_015943, partial [Zea mays]